MEDAEELLTIAQLAVGLAGFASVVVAFNRRTEITETDKFLFIAILAVSFSAVFLAFAPIGIQHLGYDGVSLWRISSGIMLAAGIALFILLAIVTPASLRTKNHLRTMRTVVAVAIPVSIWFFQLMNIFAWPIETGPFWYLLGLLLWLLVAGLDFVHVVTLGLEESER